jgi:hypothetical protein
LKIKNDYPLNFTGCFANKISSQINIYAYSREILYLRIEGKYALRNVPKNLHSIKIRDTYTA